MYQRGGNEVEREWKDTGTAVWYMAVTEYETDRIMPVTLRASKCTEV